MNCISESVIMSLVWMDMIPVWYRDRRTRLQVIIRSYFLEIW